MPLLYQDLRKTAMALLLHLVVPPTACSFAPAPDGFA